MLCMALYIADFYGEVLLLSTTKKIEKKTVVYLSFFTVVQKLAGNQFFFLGATRE